MKDRHASDTIYRVLHSPVVTEKSTTLGEGNGKIGVSYVFNVATDATKPQIKRAIEKIFAVTVEQVRTSNLKGKVRNRRHRLGGSRRGRRPTQKRAFVRIAADQHIDIWSIGGGAK